MKEERVQKILCAIHKIRASNLSVNTYFKRHDIPFSRVQYYTYCKIVKKYGEEGLRDKREEGNYTKLTQKIKDYIIFTVKHDPYITTRELRCRIQEEFATAISKSSVNNFRKTSGFISKRPEKRNAYEVQRSGGGEIMTGLAFFSGIIDVLTKTIVERVYEIRQSESFLKNQQRPKDHPDFRVQGKFTKDYNQLKSVRENRFKSIDEKIPEKNYASMNIFRMSEKVISRYNLALLCLPLVTSNGRSSRVNRVRGNDLAFLCGCNYKDATLDKYLRELKYLKISEKFVAETAKFWMRFWKERYDEETFFVCYYIDGNTKALWSSDRAYKGKVSMLGRVMNCVENVFIHDGKGHPLYFQTFQGHADLGKHALGMMIELTKHWDDQISVKRILVLDGAGNAVKTMRAFQRSGEYFITILDKNQAKERRFKHIGKGEKYPYGEATLFDCQIELRDSSEQQKNYLYESRAVIVRWVNGRESVLVTNIPCELLEAAEITKSYFDRWPMQEKQFRDAKSGLNIHRIVGYGKKSEKYEKMIEKCTSLRETIRHLKLRLKEPLREIENIEKELVPLYGQERELREKSTIESGQRILDDDSLFELKQCERQINRCLRKKRTIENQHKEDFKKLKKHMKEEERIRLKDKVYKIDTELDQIMTCFKLSFANLCSLFLSECMNHEKFEIVTLFESIFYLDGKAVITDKDKIITLSKNPKEPELMKKLEEVTVKLNGMKMINLDGLQMQFCI
jgi:transposase